MKEAGILNKYDQVLAEFPVVVQAGGAWTSVTPGSQQYWLQAFNNVLHGRWKKIDRGYGMSVLGYFGRTPLPSDPHVVKMAAEQLEMKPFDGDPLEAAPDSLAPARQALHERGLETSDENTFLVAAAIIPGKNMELNEGIRLLTGKPKIVLPLKEEEKPKVEAKPAAAAAPAFTGPMTTTCTVVEGKTTRNFQVTIAPPGGSVAAAPAPSATAPAPGGATPVFSPFEGKTELVEINAKVGDTVTLGQVVAAVEAMKAKHDVAAPCAGTVASIEAELGADIEAGQPILTITPNGG